MINQRITPSPAHSGRSLRAFFLFLSVGLAAACGGPSTATNTPATETEVPAAVPVPDHLATTAPTVVLPSIPETAVDAPMQLMAEVVLANPNSQLTQIATFVDAVQPGMGAFVTAQTFMQTLEGMSGASGLAGVDLNAPLYILVLEGEKVVTVVSMSSEAELLASMESATPKVVTHNGYAAIGALDALNTVAPYALSNLTTRTPAALPTVHFHVEKIMKGSQGEKIRQRMLSNSAAGPEAAGAQAVVDTLNNVSVVSASLEADPSGATVHMLAKVLDGPFKKFVAAQRPSDYSMLNKIGTGPWGIAGAGRIDLSVFAPLLVTLGEAEANPAITQIAAQLPSFNGEMAFGLNIPTKPEFVLGLALADGKGVSMVVDTLMAMASKQKTYDIDGMPSKLKLKSIKTRGGHLHELKAKTSTDEQISHYGKKGVSAFFGVVADNLLITFGNNAKKSAKTLTGKKGKLVGAGTKLAAAIELSKSARESLFVAMDALSMKGDRAPKDVTPFVMGLGFDENSVRGRLVIPADFVKEAASMGLF